MAALLLLRTVVVVVVPAVVVLVDMAAVATATPVPPVHLPGGKSIVVSRRGLLIWLSLHLRFFFFSDTIRLSNSQGTIFFKSSGAALSRLQRLVFSIFFQRFFHVSYFLCSHFMGYVFFLLSLTLYMGQACDAFRCFPHRLL
jgi:hypothetical protein